MPPPDRIDDRAYFLKRAREERDRAAGCQDNVAALVHLRLADEYAKRVEGLAAEPQGMPSALQDAHVQ